MASADLSEHTPSHGPLVSVIIPTYNSERYIRDTLASVFAQTYSNFELIVIDDGSSDETVSLLQTYGDRVCLVAQPNQGPAAARNHGLRLAKGELIAFLDSDDLWLPEKLDKQVRFMQQHPDCGLISTEMSTFNDSGMLDTGVKARIYNIKNGRVMRNLLFGNWIQTSGVMARRECFATVGYFTEEKGLFGEDWILWMQIAARYPIHFMEEPLAKIRILPQSFSHHDPDAQFWSLFRALEILRGTIPELAHEPRLLRDAASRICYVRALKDARSGRFQAARTKLRHALKQSIFQPRIWALLVACSSAFTWQLALQFRKLRGAE
jgi:glycosyltransferase involved in cell wall biosynthesis